MGKARNDMLTHTLIDFLMGETDGVPKDPNYIYRLYMALGNYSQVGSRSLHNCTNDDMAYEEQSCCVEPQVPRARDLIPLSCVEGHFLNIYEKIWVKTFRYPGHDGIRAPPNTVAV